MLEIKTFFGDWKEVAKEQAEMFYEHFFEHATAVAWNDRHDYFNKNHIRGGHVLLNGKVETLDEQKERILNLYKKDLIKTAFEEGKVRFICIEYLCKNSMHLNAYDMAVSILKDGYKILFDDSSITQKENEIKKRKVEKLYKEDITC